MGAKERLAELMQETGLTNQSELARRLEPPEAPTWINNRLTGYSVIKADEIPRLAFALGVPCSAFFVGSDCPEVGAASPGGAPTAAARVYQAVMGVLRDEGIIPAPTPPPYDSLTDDDLRRIFESLPEDQQELLREIARRRRELRERIIRP